MRLAIQTILFGQKIQSIGSLLDYVRQLGFQGVEFAQRPCNLGREPVPVKQLFEMCAERGLSVVGLAGGTLKERVSYCEAFRPGYLYTENVGSDEHLRAEAAGFTLALHPHVFKWIHRLAQAEAALERWPKLKYIVDTAHLTIAGDDPCLALRRNVDRIAAVHLKDWTRAFGSAAFHYAKGFVPLGCGGGEIRLEAVLATLRSLNYSGWIVLEQDSPNADTIETAVAKSLTWLAENGLLARPQIKAALASDTIFEPRGSPAPAYLTQILSAGLRGPVECIRSILAAVREESEADEALAWAADDLASLLYCIASVNREDEVGRVVRRDDCVWHEVYTTKDFVRGECPTLPHAQHGPQQPDRSAADPRDSFVCLPLLNPSNWNHVWFVVQLNYRGQVVPVDCEDRLRRCAAHAANALSQSVEAELLRASIQATQLAPIELSERAADPVGSYLARLAALVSDFVKADAAQVYRVDESTAELVPHARVGDKPIFADSMARCGKGETILGQVWSENESRLSLVCDENSSLIYAHLQPGEGERSSLLAIPLRSASRARVIGVVCCSRLTRRANETQIPFTEVDLAIAEAVVDAGRPYLELLLDSQRRLRAQRQLVHEFGHPLRSLRGLLSQFRKNARIVRCVHECFTHDYLADADSWSELLVRLLEELHLMEQSGSGALNPRFALTSLVSDVIAPATRRAAMLHEDRPFPMSHIRRDTVSQNIPPLFLDKTMFQQVVFNILENSIKYAYRDPQAFQVFIGGERRDGRFLITFEDFGIGFDPGSEEHVFAEGGRGKNAQSVDYFGQGLGLWFVREIVRAHGGEVSITSLSLPTRIEISLPVELEDGPPQHRRRPRK
jgi:sugar phosphate isomerase/epimerase/signal transduction histidine kinase